MKKALIILLALCLYACGEFSSTNIQEDDIVLKNLDFDYVIPQESYPIDNDIVKLGRVLFYDGILSQNGEVSCASCHIQEAAFGDSLQFSLGFEGGLTTSNSPTLFNIGFDSRYFWNGRARELHDAAISPIFNPLEMGLTRDELSARINASDVYKELTENAFGTDNLSNDLIGESLSQFMGSMQSFDSKFDQWKSQGYNGVFNNEERWGSFIFESQCNDCHQVFDRDPYLGGEQEIADNGLPFDFGDAPINPPPTYYGHSAEFFALRIPTLRNLAHTAPYMHDGRFSTLEEVLNHYAGGVSSEGRRIESDVDRVKQINLAEDEIEALIAFLNTMADDAFLQEKFSDPIIR
jgi:cytochrome c peroxidase